MFGARNGCDNGRDHGQRFAQAHIISKNTSEHVVRRFAPRASDFMSESFSKVS
jgi:hypothetical protein